MTRRTITTLALGACALVIVTSACGGGDSGGGTVAADGSSTVGPFTTKAAEDWRADGGGDVTVGISGTGGGFERFCAGETDLSNASRQIEDDEVALCQENGVEFIELEVAADAITNVVNTGNDWATCLTVEQLNAIWEPGSTVKNWSQVDPAFPDVSMRLYGPGTDSGTFDYFTDAINGEEGASRTDYAASEDDNVIVQGVSGDRGAMGYFGLSYYEENQDQLKAVEVDGGDGCVAPSAETVQDGSYTPLSRPLYVYVSTASLEENDAVEEFLRYALENGQTIAREALFVGLGREQLDEQLTKLDAATGATQ